jgi:hypothetical protein
MNQCIRMAGAISNSALSERYMLRVSAAPREKFFFQPDTGAEVFDPSP